MAYLWEVRNLSRGPLLKPYWNLYTIKSNKREILSCFRGDLVNRQNTSIALVLVPVLNNQQWRRVNTVMPQLV